MGKSTYIAIIAPALSMVLLNPARAQMADMVKGMISSFDEMKPVEYDRDEIIEGAAAFPVDGGISEEIYVSALNGAEDLFSLSDPRSGYSVIDGRDYPTNSVTLKFSYLSLPCFQCLNGWMEEVSVKDSGGRDLRMKEKQMEAYRELGIIDEGYGFPVPGEYTEEIWLNREPGYGEMIRLAGKVRLECPDDYEMAVFTQADTIEPRTVGGLACRLIGIDRDIVTLLVRGDRRKMEALRQIVLNRDDMPFGSMSSVSIDAGMYDLENKTVRNLTDAEIEEAVNGFDMSETMVEQVRKIKVYGKADKLVLLKVNTTKLLDHSFDVTLSSE